MVVEFRFLSDWILVISRLHIIRLQGLVGIQKDSCVRPSAYLSSWIKKQKTVTLADKKMSFVTSSALFSAGASTLTSQD